MGFFDKTVGEQCEVTGKVVVAKHTRAMRKSERNLIPATPAPATRWQKFKRSAVG